MSLPDDTGNTIEIDGEIMIWGRVGGPLKKCMLCNNEFGSVYVAKSNGKHYCFDCYRRHRREIDEQSPGDNTASIHAVTAAEHGTASTGAVLPAASVSKPSPSGVEHQDCAHQSALVRCVACRAFASQHYGKFEEDCGFICGTCLKEAEEIDAKEAARLSDTSMHTNLIKKHIRLKLKGNPTAIEFFHFVMNKLDTDWPWLKGWPLNMKSTEQCIICGGHLYSHPLFEPDEIKTIASECGVGKLKIKYFGDASKCAGGVN